MKPSVFNMNNHNVNVKELKSVVVMTALEERIPLCPIFFDMIKLELVVALPSMIREATSLSSL